MARRRETKAFTNANFCPKLRMSDTVGLGGTGRFMARFAHAFGMRPLAWSPNLTSHAAVEANAEKVTFEELLRRSDVVSLHIVLSGSTRHLIDERALALMKASSVLVNTSRGGLVDESALVAALRARTIRAAALDTFEIEPLPERHPLLSLDNVILTPHAAGYTAETYRAWYEGAVEAILAFLRGEAVPVRHDQFFG